MLPSTDHLLNLPSHIPSTPSRGPTGMMEVLLPNDFTSIRDPHKIGTTHLVRITQSILPQPHCHICLAALDENVWDREVEGQRG